MAKSKVSTLTDLIRDDYREAVASSILGEVNNEAWSNLRQALADAIVSAWLSGAVQTVEGFPKNDGDLFEEPPKVMFAKPKDSFEELFTSFDISPELEAGVNYDALDYIESRLPVVRSTIPEVEKLAGDIATDVMTEEINTVLEYMQNTSSAVSAGMQNAFYVSDVDQKTVKSIKHLLADAIRGVMPDDQINLPEFISRTRLLGAVSLTDARIETIFRTNLSTAANEGVMSIMRDPIAKTLFPLVMITEIVDNRSRPHHAAMDGFITTPEMIDRLNLRPPNGYNCRGSLIKISFDEALEMGLLDANGNVDIIALDRHNTTEQKRLIANGVYPDQGFKSKGLAA